MKRLMYKYFSIVIAIIFSFPVIISAIDLKPKDKGWVEKSAETEFKTYYREIKGSGTREVLMIGILNTDPKNCFDIVGDYLNFPSFMPYIKYTKIIHSEKIDENKTINYVFFYLNPPLVSARYYTLKLNDEKNADGKPGVFRSQWKLEKGQYRKTPNDAEIKNHIKTGWQDPIETAFNNGYWQFEPEENGTKTRVSYYVWTNPGGSIPNWIANKANTVALPELWKALKERLKNPKYSSTKKAKVINNEKK